MGYLDLLTYVFTNPVTTGTVAYAARAASSAVNYIGLQPKTSTDMVTPTPLWKLVTMTGPYMRLAALSGTTAVILGAFGAHKKFDNPDQKRIFETANRFHFYHSLALMGVPFCRAHACAATFFVSAMLLFCGTCYYSSCTSDQRFNKVTPIGGICFMIGWICMCI